MDHARRAARLGVGAATIPAPPPTDGVVLLFDRHVEKNGSGSLRLSMQDSNCTFHGQGATKSTFLRIAHHLQHNDSTCVEAHSPVADDWLDRIAKVSCSNCAKLTALRIRRPDDHYRSFYAWGGPSWVNFSDWFPGNLQTAIIRHSYSAVGAQRNQTIPSVGEAECDAVARMVRRVDFLYATEESDCYCPSSGGTRILAAEEALAGAAETAVAPQPPPLAASVADPAAERGARVVRLGALPHALALRPSALEAVVGYPSGRWVPRSGRWVPKYASV